MKKLLILISLGIFLLISCEKEEIFYPDYSLRFEQEIFDSIKITRDIHYKTAQTISNNEIELSFDFFEPRNDTSKTRPLVVMVHGGGFFQGEKDWMDYAAKLLPAYGYNCASISYRLYDKSNYPISNKDLVHSLILAREDLISAINFFVNDASGVDRYKTDVNNFFIMGASAGALTAFHAVPLDFSSLENEDLKIVLADPGWDINLQGLSNLQAPIRGIVGLAGAIGDPSWLTDNYPPVFCVHGMKDNIVPYSKGRVKIYNMISPFQAYGSDYICSKLTELESVNTIVSDPDGGHDNFFLKTELWQTQAIDFLKSQIVSR